MCRYCHLVVSADNTLLGRAEIKISARGEGHHNHVIHVCLIGTAGSEVTDPVGPNFAAADDC